MKLLEGKKGLILGVANDRSIAWGIAQACHEHGAELGFTYLNEAFEKRVRPLAESLGADLILPCDAQKDDDIAAVMSEVEKRWEKIDFLIHSIAYAKGEDLKGPFHETSREGFMLAMDISVYSFIKLVSAAKPLMKDGGSALTLTFHGAQQVIPRYRVMGVAKAALEASVRELAADFGGENIRVNAISAGAIKTLAASGLTEFRELLNVFETRAPLKKAMTIDDVGKSAVYLVSDLASAVTGEIHYVDCGFNITAG